MKEVGELGPELRAILREGMGDQAEGEDSDFGSAVVENLVVDCIAQLTWEVEER